MNSKTLLSIMLGILLVANILMVSAVTIKDVSSTPDEVEPGEVFDISIEIENTHYFNIEDIKVRLILTEEKGETNPLTGIAETQGAEVPFAPYQASSEKFLEDLESDKKEDFKFKLIVLPDTSTGVYKVGVEITYVDGEGNDYSKDELISVIVNSKPELKVSLEDSIVLIKGQENTFSVRLVNSGLADVKFVYMNAREVSGMRYISEKEQYIGDVDSDDFDSVEFTVYIEEGASNSLHLPLNLKFRDATNKEFSQMKSVVLKVYTLEEARELGLVAKPSYKYQIIAGVVVVLYFGYRYNKKRKMKRLRGK